MKPEFTQRVRGPIPRRPGIILTCETCGYVTECWSPFIMNVIRCSICNSKEVKISGIPRRA